VAGPVVLAVVYFTVPLDVFRPSRPVLGWSVFIIALGVLALLLLRQIGGVLADDRTGRPGLEIPLLVALSLVVFAATYLTLARDPGQFQGVLRTRTDALYFTVVTASTIGYGDITPVGQNARVVVMLQVLYNFVFIAAALTAFTTRMRERATTRVRRRATKPDPAADPDPDQGSKPDPGSGSGSGSGSASDSGSTADPREHP